MVFKSGNRGRTEKRRTVASAPRKSKPDGHNGTHKPRRQQFQDEEEHLDASDDAASVAGSVSSDEGESTAKKTTAYSSLLESLGGLVEEGDRPTKRRKTQAEDATTSANGTLEPLNGEVVQNGQRGTETTAEKSEAENASEHGDEGDALQSEDDEDDENTQSSPFVSHFSPATDSDLDATVKQAAESKWHTAIESGQKWKITRQDLEGTKATGHTYKEAKDLPLKQRLRDESASLDVPQSQETSGVMTTMYNYKDLLYTSRKVDRPFFRDLTSLHILNHILTGRDRVLRNSARLASAASDLDDQSFRDQGFTRPKVLILLETREQCYRWITSVMRFFAPEQRENWSRFEDSFHAASHVSPSMPDDYISLFDGNADNDFRLAVKFTRKTVKLFASFYQADLLICSPLGLRRVMAHSDPKKRDSDFLSSIEVLVLDQAHAMQAQNWEHVSYCVDQLNQQPRDAHGTDFNRVRSWYLDGHAQYLRQTIVATSFLTPEINAIFNTKALNISGRTKIQPTYDGAIQSLSLPSGIKQTFSRFDSPSPAADPDSRFAFFCSAILPAIVKSASASSTLSPAGILVFIPSYLDFVRLRNFFAGSSETENISFGAVSEYSSVSDARRARSHLVSGKHHVMLYSGRAHHFHRYRIKGVKRVIWYGLPDDEVFYQELVSAVGDTVDEGKAGAAEVGCRAVFSRWDGLKLERVVGSARVRQMLTDKGGDTYDFV